MFRRYGSGLIRLAGHGRYRTVFDVMMGSLSVSRSCLLLEETTCRKQLRAESNYLSDMSS